MWYCEIEFISKSKKRIVFSNEEEAEEFYGKFKSMTNGLLEVNDDRPMLINVNNVEVISKPKQYIEE